MVYNGVKYYSKWIYPKNIAIHENDKNQAKKYKIKKIKVFYLDENSWEYDSLEEIQKSIDNLIQKVSDTLQVSERYAATLINEN